MYHFARRFKALVGVTPKQFTADTRLKRLKGGLKTERSVVAAIYDAATVRRAVCTRMLPGVSG